MIGKQIDKTLKTIDPTYLALGYLRYEALRKLDPRQYAELWKQALKGRHFDELVDEIVGKRGQHDA